MPDEQRRIADFGCNFLSVDLDVRQDDLRPLCGEQPGLGLALPARSTCDDCDLAA
ncbi:hypothetical protein D3C84_1230930 [compost metagenome]